MKTKKTSEWKVYIIQSRSGLLYTGITTDIKKRFNDHSNGKLGAKFFHFSRPKQIVFQESHPNRSEATKREIQIKKMSRSQKLDLIQSTPQN